MNYLEEINEARNIIATDLFEPEENTLHFILIIGLVSDTPIDIHINGGRINKAYEVSYDGSNNRYKIYFDSYICYSVINESYEQLGGVSFSGNKIRVYADSNFLNYVKADTFATNKYPEEFKHFAFITQNHIINVASVEEPIIEKLKE
ncbi:MAG: hypothetical protein M3Q05_08495 [Bacteroidota bacterium]|nr:hypothetical protein [Bacteroidota bacterium]